MKKSLKTRLTAAAFAAAAALGLAGCTDPGTGVSGTDPVAPGIGDEEDVYGPPVDYAGESEEPETTVKQTAASEETTAAKQTTAAEKATTKQQATEETATGDHLTIATEDASRQMMQCVYGPPPDLAEPETEANVETDEPENAETSRPEDDIPVPVYGPPESFE
ncbi:MAG: hypothetical protein IJ595_01470 [Oscillospiraceae bacterium]|nr:hypothetical protein [Oscillospiraceae bacterium]